MRDVGEGAPIKKTGSIGSIMTMSPNAEASAKRVSTSAAGTPVVLRVHIPAQDVKKAIRVNSEESIWQIKKQIIEKLGKGLDEALNFGIYLPGTDGKEGKFFDENRSLQDYRLGDNVRISYRLARFIHLRLLDHC